MALIRRLVTLAAAGEAARQYARRNPEQAARYLDHAASFVDKQTKGRWSGQISGVTRKAKSIAGIPGSGPVVEGQVTPPGQYGQAAPGTS